MMRNIIRVFVAMAAALILFGVIYVMVIIPVGIAAKASAAAMPKNNAMPALSAGTFTPTSAKMLPTTLPTTPWPTVDTRYLAPHQTEVALAALEAQAAQAQANAYEKKVSVDMTASAATEAKNSRDFATNAAIATTHYIAGLTATPIAQAIANIEAAKTAQVEQRRAQQRARDREDILLGAALLIICVITIAMIVVMANGMVTRQWVAARSQIAALAMNTASSAGKTAEAGQAILINQSDDSQAYSAKRIPPPPGSSEKFALWAKAALNGESVAVDEWEQKDSPYPGYREYRHGVYLWIITNALTEYNSEGKRVLNETGRKIIQAWLNSYEGVDAHES